ncbi:MAG: cephalosporin hydroxylase family protein [Deltaproteobacteria bacterium]|nr:cephalosporin hydroxylase family protein [Deltaproteobacteria bacterium]
MASIANDPKNIDAMASNPKTTALVSDYFENARRFLYAYNFSWLGIPIIQHPADLIAFQELVWTVKPRLIIETGVAHGGSMVFYASLLKMMDIPGRVIGIDVDIRPPNRKRLDQHPLRPLIDLVEGSSVDPSVVEKIHHMAKGQSPVLVALDSHHTHDHVLKELRAYSDLVTKGSYLVVQDTRIEDVDASLIKDRPWGKGNNPKTAVWEFLKSTDRFEIDREIEKRILFTGAPDGYLKRVKD